MNIDNLVLNLLEGLDGTGKNIYTDNLYTSIPLYTKLLEKGFKATGTIHKNHKGLPEYSAKNNLVRGESKFWSKGSLMALVW